MPDKPPIVTTAVKVGTEKKPSAAKVDRALIPGWAIERASAKLVKFLNEKFGDDPGTNYYRAEQPTFIFFRKDVHDTINHPSDGLLSGRPRYEWADSEMPGVKLGTLIDYANGGPKTNADLID